MIPAQNITEIVSVASIFLALLALLLYWDEARKFSRFKHQFEIEDKKTMSKIQTQGVGVLARAVKKASAIIGLAEIQGIKTLAASKLQTRQMGEKFEQEMEKRGGEVEKKLEKVVTDRTEVVLSGFESRLGEFLNTTEKRVTDDANGAFQRVEGELNDYKSTRKKEIDEKALAVMEAVIPKLVTKKINLSDHVDLVYEAIEEAKKEKFL